MSSDEADTSELPQPAGNRFDRLEWAGAFGDLGTLVPFVVAYITVLGIDPFGVLFAFGACMIAAGLYYKTPFPVQPMKAIGAIATTQAAQTAVITAGAVHAAALATGLIWLFLGLTGLGRRVAGLIPRPIAIGIILGLGFAFMLEGARFMAQGWLLSGIALAATLLLLVNRAVPVMFLLLAGGAAVALVRDPDLLTAFASVQIEPRLPEIALGGITWNEIVIGIAFLALPQVPLTLGNAILAVTEENNRLFPHRPVSIQTAAVSTGAMNLFSGSVGGVPMCHGAGGMAGHVRFGARTGGAPIILGVLLILLAVFFSGSAQLLFRVIPSEILGVILFLTGAQLALGSCDFSRDKGERFATLVTAALSMWNIGIAFVVGIALYHLLKREWVRL